MSKNIKFRKIINHLQLNFFQVSDYFWYNVPFENNFPTISNNFKINFFRAPHILSKDKFHDPSCEVKGRSAEAK